MNNKPEKPKNATAISEEAVRKATGKSWEDWFAVLNAIKAAELSHPAIAGKLYDDYGVEGWWAQMIAVEFERSIGRRETGQRCDGTYAASSSKTLQGGMDAVLEWWQALAGPAQDFNGVAFSAEPGVIRLINGGTGASSLPMAPGSTSILPKRMPAERSLASSTKAYNIKKTLNAGRLSGRAT